jgi:hypothetical protein
MARDCLGWEAEWHGWQLRATSQGSGCAAVAARGESGLPLCGGRVEGASESEGWDSAAWSRYVAPRCATSVADLARASRVGACRCIAGACCAST